MKIKSNQLLRPILIIVVATLCLAIGYTFGRATSTDSVNQGVTVRSNNYRLVKPLLFGGYGDDKTSESLLRLEQQIDDYLTQQQQAGNINQAAVHIRKLEDNQQLSLHNDKQFNPASLMKLPLAMVYYSADSSQPGLLDERGQINFDQDYNQGQAIAPQQAPVNGQSYTVRQLIEMMLVNSDNIGYHLLLSRAQIAEKLNLLLREIRIDMTKMEASSPSGKDVLTVKEAARFFRLLYNATYVDAERSQEILEYLVEATYKDGIRSGLPDNLKVASKYGYDTQSTPATSESQLHECGIVYTNSPYLLCVMTKSSQQTIDKQEAVLGHISKMVYQDFNQ